MRINSSMNSRYMIYSILTSLVIVGIYQIFALGKFNYPEFKLKEGQVSENEVIAPFDFPILKPAPELLKEQEKALLRVNKPYVISEVVMFDVLASWDDIFEIITADEGVLDTQLLSSELSKAGWIIKPENLAFAANTSIRDKVYNSVRQQLSELYLTGVYDKVEGDSILIALDDTLEYRSTSSFYSKAQVEQKILAMVPQAAEFTRDISDSLVKPNIMLNETKLSELNNRSLGAIPISDGVVLQNEVIVRKNARITPEDLSKLESLQEAYKSRNISKTPVHELFLMLGLFLYIFIAVSLANHYFGVQSKEDRIPVADFAPVNIGFVVLVLFATINNYVLGYNNLLVPFAMMAISATILVGFEYGVLYSICSLLVISPFLNWETYTPIVLLLSTLITLILIKRQNSYHEFTMIGVYLVASTCTSIIIISIYKNDSIISIIRSVGFGIGSVLISISGVLGIVPLYEKKWNRATKQTLLELLDFNHPLMKKLATEAVGTYHHSLVVGNLAERAAEEIGANPLLARVGSYYHDIGKIINSNIFTENNKDSADIHNDLSTDESARLIKSHVTEGIELARKYKLPQPVIDIVLQHHGDSKIKYFYDKAAKDSSIVDILNYVYDGPKPQTKEASLVMLADIVESTTKSKNTIDEDEILRIIQDTITRLIKEGQFDDSPITIKDLNIAKISMLPILASIYRKRLDYLEDTD